MTATPVLSSIVSLYKERTVTLNALADATEVFYIEPVVAPELLAAQLTPDVMPAMREFVMQLQSISWEAVAISGLIKEILIKHSIKMPKLAMPLRMMLTGQTQTPSLDSLITLFPRNMALTRITRYVAI